MMVDYYDVMLLAVGAAIAAGVVVSAHPSIAINQGLAGGSLLATLILFEILFHNPPTEQTTSTTVAPVVVGMGWLLAIVLSV